jgi:hypothetical protein
MSVKESANYDNFLDADKRDKDEYGISLDRFMDEPVQPVLYDQTKAKSQYDDVYKVLYVHFRSLDDVADFCSKIGQIIHSNDKAVFFPLNDPAESLFPEEQATNIEVDKQLVKPKRANRKAKVDTTLDVELAEDGDKNAKWSEHWQGMPEFIQEDCPPYRTVHIMFRTEEHYKDFAKRIGQKHLSEKSKSIWHPKLEITANRLLRWVDESQTLPQFPMYIVSKGRHESMHTSRSLARMKIPHYIVIEPQDFDDYDKALDNFSIRDYVTLLVAPFSNHGDGPGRARNWAWDHSISLGATSHWVFDDNISDFYRLNENKRIRFESGAGFRAMEDFVGRYDNVYIAGPQYRFFIAPDQKYPPYVANTRIYSSLLIRNDCKHRWRGRYNEDTDICLRVMKDGDVCVQFNAFLQGKAATQTVAGGNTAEFYHAENVESEGFKETGYNTEGTVNKSQMLVDMHPDVARLVWRYGRWHHFVDYTPFKKNLLKLKKDVIISSDNNEYGMRLETNFQE